MVSLLLCALFTAFDQALIAGILFFIFLGGGGGRYLSSCGDGCFVSGFAHGASVEVGNQVVCILFCFVSTGSVLCFSCL